jgi:MOSC domain-containing protein YiiM
MSTHDNGTVADLLATYVGRPRPIGTTRGRVVESAIGKARVEAATIELGETNLAGDRQADLRVHGGPDKAVYAYPSEHVPAWQADGFAVEAGGLGENLSLAGATERDALLGDVWRWGGALVQVSQPRAPCFKLAIHAGRKDIGPRMIETRRSGWYLRVLEPGVVPTSGPLVLVQRDDGAPSVHDAFAAMFATRDGNGSDDGHGSDGTDSTDAAVDDEVVARLLASPALAESWRASLAARRAGSRR